MYGDAAVGLGFLRSDHSVNAFQTRSRGASKTRVIEKFGALGGHSVTSLARRSSDWFQPCSIPLRYCAAAGVTITGRAESVSFVVLPACSENVNVFSTSKIGLPFSSSGVLVKTSRSGGMISR